MDIKDRIAYTEGQILTLQNKLQQLKQDEQQVLQNLLRLDGAMRELHSIDEENSDVSK